MRFDSDVYNKFQLGQIKHILEDNQVYFDSKNFSSFGEWITNKAPTPAISAAIFYILIDTEISPFNIIKDVPTPFLIYVCATLNSGSYYQNFSTFEYIPLEYIEFFHNIGVKIYKYDSNLYMIIRPGMTLKDIIEVMKKNPYFEDKSNISGWEEI